MHVYVPEHRMGPTDLTSFTNAAESGCYICEPLLHHALSTCGTPENCMVKPYSYRIYESNFIIGMMMLLDGEETSRCRIFETIPSSRIITDFVSEIEHRASRY
jgi:hypothetical protein